MFGSEKQLEVWIQSAIKGVLCAERPACDLRPVCVCAPLSYCWFGYLHNAQSQEQNVMTQLLQL